MDVVGRQAEALFAAVFPRWGVACTAAESSLRAIFHVTAACRPSTSSDDKLRYAPKPPCALLLRLCWQDGAVSFEPLVDNINQKK